jgi:hypothetical protein
MYGLKTLKTVVAAGVLALMASGAQAATTTLCPNSSSTTDREFTLTTEDPIGNSCFASGSPNDNNDAVFQAMLANLVPAATLLGKVEYDKFGVLQSTGPEVSLLDDMIALLSGNSGGFTLDLTGIVNAVLVFKVGNNPGPAYAAFTVDSGLVTGFWSSTPLQGGGLSHVSLYGAPAAVPVPAAGFLLIGALGGLAALRRRRKA